MLKRALLYGAVLIVLLLMPLFTATYIGNPPYAELITVEPSMPVAVPVVVSHTSNLTMSFSGTEPVEAFILNSSQWQSLVRDQSLNGFEYASGIESSGHVEAVLLPGDYSLTFFNFGTTPSITSFTRPTLSPPSTAFTGYASKVLSAGSAFSLSPGRYVAVKLNVPQNQSSINAYFSYQTPQNQFNYYPFTSTSYLMTAQQFAEFLQGGAAAPTIVSIWSGQAGFFPNAIRQTAQAGVYYLVMYDDNATEPVLVTFPQGVDIVSPGTPIGGANASVQVGTLESVVSFTPIGSHGYPFAIAMNGMSHESAGPILFLAPNGTYSWSIESIAHKSVSSRVNDEALADLLEASPGSGQVDVEGKPVNVTIEFQLVRYSVTFVETGLPGGSAWSVAMNGTTIQSTTNQISFQLVNDSSYPYAVTPPQGYTASPSSGVISLEGADVTRSVEFTPVA